MQHRRLSAPLSVALGLFTCLTLASIASPQQAQAQDSGFGLGVMLGDPAGLSGKFWLNGSQAIDFGVGFGIIEGDGVAGHVDWLWHRPLKSLPRARFDLYFGIGPKIAAFRDNVWLGARAPVGLDFLFTRVPLDVFVEIAAGLWIVERTRFDIDTAVGVRYWF